MRTVILAAAVVFFVLWAILSLRNRRRTGFVATAIAADDPLMLESFAKARDSIPLLREHFGDAAQAAAKFPVSNAEGEIEHVWGDILSVKPDHLVAVITTPLILGDTPEGPRTVGFDSLEDWQLFMPDGKIRGGFSTQAQLAVARRDGHPIPHNVAEQEDRFIDR